MPYKARDVTITDSPKAIVEFLKKHGRDCFEKDAIPLLKKQQKSPASGTVSVFSGEKETPASVSRSLQGDWVVVGMEDKGYKARPQELQGMRWVINGDIITATDPDGSTGKMRYKIDPNVSPGHFDITSLQGKLKGKQILLTS